MSSQIKDFRATFQNLFDDGLPSFWDDEGRLFSQEQYHSLLVQNCMDHSKFEDLVKGLTGKVIVEKLTEDSEISDRFLIIKKGLPVVSYESYVDLEVSIREMTDYDTHVIVCAFFPCEIFSKCLPSIMFSFMSECNV